MKETKITSGELLQQPHTIRSGATLQTTLRGWGTAQGCAWRLWAQSSPLSWLVASLHKHTLRQTEEAVHCQQNRGQETQRRQKCGRGGCSKKRKRGRHEICEKDGLKGVVAKFARKKNTPRRSATFRDVSATFPRRSATLRDAPRRFRDVSATFPRHLWHRGEKPTFAKTHL